MIKSKYFNRTNLLGANLSGSILAIAITLPLSSSSSSRYPGGRLRIL